jgi:DNA-binding GntR family transcriptional regulator
MEGRRASTSAVYEKLRADILAGRFQPGERLPFANVCSMYDTSAGALREVLMRLSEQGLVRNEPQQGFSVAPTSVDDLQELTEVRCEVEDILVRRAIAEGSVTWEADLLHVHHVMGRTQRCEPENPETLTDEWAFAHSAFHNTLLNGCRNNRFKEIARSARDSAELYRRWISPVDLEGDRDVDGEHQELLDAALDRDAERAASLLRRHIALTTEIAVLRIEAAGREPEVSTTIAPVSPQRKKSPARKSGRPGTRGRSEQSPATQRLRTKR